MKNYRFDDEFVTRIAAFLDSPEYGEQKEFSKSDYWKNHSELFDLKIHDNNVSITGSSGFYVPNVNYLGKAIKSPKTALKRCFRWLANHWGITHIKNHSVAFEQIMAFDAADSSATSYADYFGAQSRYRLNPLMIARHKGAYESIGVIKAAVKKRYKLNFQMVYSYYIFNILNFFAGNDKNKTILEIGGGSGNLLSVMFDNFPGATLIDVDLPETLSSAILFIKDLYPAAKILMPNEIYGESVQDFDFVFLTPAQTDNIKSDSLDIVTNLCSFQEMTKEQVTDYFDLIDRCAKDQGIFLTTNRAEKFSNSPGDGGLEKEPSRFADYPWRRANKILAYEVCPLFYLTNPNCHFIRAEVVQK